MIPSIRKRFNASFSTGKYQNFLEDLDRAAGFKIKFRVAETPLFIPSSFKQELLRASNEIIEFLQRPDFVSLTDRAIPGNCRVPHESSHTEFLALDFAIVDDHGTPIPQLIEMQGFPSLFGFQDLLANLFRSHYEIPEGFSNHFGLSSVAYQERFRKLVLGSHHPENVILLEIDPLAQNTAVDFVITRKLTGVEPVHIGDVKRDGRKLLYQRNGKWTPIYRIYNRVIFDELLQRKDLKLDFNLTEEVDVEWAGHPNWFYRISKFTMPLIKSRYIPECKFMSEFEAAPADMENYVLKPLFSFSGSGVVFHATKDDFDAVPESERENFLLQRKVKYEPVIEAPDGLVKAEIRLLYFWEQSHKSPELVTNLARLSRGEMIGVKFNKDKTWVGGTVCFFER